VLSHRDISRALLIEAYTDLKAAQVLRQAGIYARCIAHCQHTVEKTLKAALAIRDVLITDRHEISEDFRQTCFDWECCSELADIAVEMEAMRSRTEYPLFGRRDLPIWLPSERYTEADADEALEKTRYVFNTVKCRLSDEYDIHFEIGGDKV